MFSWQTMRALLNGKPPIPTGAIIAVVPILAIVSAWVRPLTGVDSLSPWLKIMYFSSLAYFVSCAIFAAFCPAVIKEHKSALHRIDVERNTHANSNPSYRFEIVITQLGENERARIELLRLASERDEAIGPARATLDEEINRIVEREWVNCVQQYLAREYDKANTSRGFARCCCALGLATFGLGVVAVLVHRTILVISG